jgi:hypothetical protein
MKTLCRFLFVGLCFLGVVSGAAAEDFAFTDYTFVWNAAKEGNVGLTVRKDPGGLRFLLGSMGGRVATVSMTAAEAVAVGKVLLGTEAVYADHQGYYDANRETNKPAFNKEKSDTVKADAFQVVFHSSPGGSNFTVKVSEAKTFSTMTLLSRDEALKMGEHLVKAEAMADFVNRHLKF